MIAVALELIVRQAAAAGNPTASAGGTAASAVPNITYPLTYPLSEAENAALFAPIKLFSMRCLFSQLPIDVFFCGVYTLMLTRYLEYEKDTWWTKGTVYAVSFMAYLISGFNTFFVSNLFVINFGLYSPFFDPTYSSWFPFLDAITACLTQCFFAFRAFRLMGRNYYLLSTLVLLIAASLGSGFSIPIIWATRLQSLLQATQVRPSMLVWLASSMVANVILTVTILWGLLQSRTGWAQTDKVIFRLVRMTVEAQLLPTIISVAMFAEFLATPSSLLGNAFQGVLSKLYCLSLLYSLNSRQNLKKIAVAVSTANQYTGQNVNAIQVDVETETYETRTDGNKYNFNPHVSDLEKVDHDDEDEWETDMRAEAGGDATFGSIQGSVNSHVHLTPPTPKSGTTPLVQ